MTVVESIQIKQLVWYMLIKCQVEYCQDCNELGNPKEEKKKMAKSTIGKGGGTSKKVTSRKEEYGG